MKKILDNKEKEIIFKIMEIAKKIISFYQELNDLEIKGKKDSLEYQKKLNYLNLCQEVEEELYQSIFSDPKEFEQISKFLDYLDPNRLFRVISDDSIILNHFEDLLVMKRIYNHFQDIYTKKLIEVYQANFEEEENRFDTLTFTSLAIKEDFLKILLFLTSKIKENPEISLIKYWIIFLNPTMRLELEEEDTLFLTSRSYADAFGIPEKVYNALLKKYISKNIKPLLNKTISKGEDDKDYKEIILKSLQIACYFLDNSKEKKLFHDIIKKENKLIDTYDQDIVVLRSERLEINGSCK